jgi:hypothetical protein
MVALSSAINSVTIMQDQSQNLQRLYCWVCPLQLVSSDQIELNSIIYLLKQALDWEDPR